MFAYIVFCGSEQDARVYDTEVEASVVAASKTAATGSVWETRWVYIPEDF